MGKLTEQEITAIEDLLENCAPIVPEEDKYVTVLATGVYQNESYRVTTTPPHQEVLISFTTYDLSNSKLINHLSKLAKEDPSAITSIHKISYTPGSETLLHHDPTSTTLNIILKADDMEGGEFFINDKIVPNFNKRGDFLTYNGRNTYHGVTKLKKGHREVLVGWWDRAISPKTSLI